MDRTGERRDFWMYYNNIGFDEALLHNMRDVLFFLFPAFN